MTVVEPGDVGEQQNEEVISESEEGLNSGSESGDVQEDKDNAPSTEKPVEDDLDRRNPQYTPKGGAFYEHDNRTLDEEPETPTDAEKKKKVWKESKSSERWLHDCFVEDEQVPKSAQELVDVYGYDIRHEETAPRARRRRKYGRGPDKYDRKWNDEEAYATSQKQGRGRGRRRRGEEFPPLPNQVDDSKGRGRGTPSQSTSGWRGKPADSTPPKREVNTNVNSSASRSRIDENIKPFMHDSARHSISDNISTPKNHRAPQMKPVPKDVQDLAHSMSQMSVQHRMKTKDPPTEIHNSKQHPEPSVNKQNPKRYSKIRKNFTGYFPPEDIVELDPRDAKQALEVQQHQSTPQLMPPGPHLTQQQQQQELLAQGVLQRYPDSFNGNPAYLSARPLLQPIPQPGLSPQALPSQALSPQLPGIPGIEMAQSSLPPQANYGPPLYIDMETHYPPQGEVLPYQGYPPYPQGQSTELYQASSGITYYSPEIQTGAGQPRALPPRRPKAAIPIIPPPETH